MEKKKVWLFIDNMNIDTINMYQRNTEKLLKLIIGFKRVKIAKFLESIYTNTICVTYASLI